MVFEKKQLSKALAIALMVACAVAFMPLLNGQAFAAAKKPAKVKSLKAAQVADTMTAKATWKKGKNCKKYNVKVDGVLVAKKQKAKSYTTEALTEGAHKIAVAGVNGKKVGKYKTVTVNIVAPTPPTPKLEVTGVVQSGIKQLKVTFSTAVTDPSALKFVVTRAGKEVTATAKADPNDPNSVLLDLDAAIADGAAYAVKVTTADGTEVPTAAGATTDVTGQKEAVASIAIEENVILDQDTAYPNPAPATPAYAYADTFSAKAYLKVLNQFGEDRTAAYYSDVTISSTIGTVYSNPPVNKDGMVQLYKIPTIQGIAGTTGQIVAVYTKTGVSSTQTVTVGQSSKIKEIEVAGIYNKVTGAAMAIMANDANENKNAVIKFAVKDQYGKADSITPDDTAGTGNITATLVGGLTKLEKAAGIQAWTATDEDAWYIDFLSAANLKNAQAGNASLIMVANATGAKAQFDFTVADTNVIADFTITQPDMVIGGVENTFGIEAKNAAGEPITKFDLINKKLTVNGTDKILSTSFVDGWKLKKANDGTAQLIYKPAPNETTMDRIDTATFQARESFKTSFITMNVKPGNGIPAEVSELTTEGTASTDTAKIKDLTVVDVFGSKVNYPAWAAAKAGQYAVNIEMTNNVGGKAKLNTSAAPGTSVSGQAGIPDDSATSLSYDLQGLDAEKILVTDSGTMIEGESVSPTITATIYAYSSTTSKWSAIGTSSKSAKVGIAKDIAGDEYDSYALELVGDNTHNDPDPQGTEKFLADNTDKVYLGTYSAAYGEWDQPKREYKINVYGMMDTSPTTKYPVTTGYKLYAENGVIVGQNGYALEAYDEMPAAGYEGDTITLKLAHSGSEVKATLPITYSTEAPAVTALDKKAKKYVYEAGTVDQGDSLTPAMIDAAFNGYVEDQYGFAKNLAGKATYTFQRLETAAGETVDEDLYDVTYDEGNALTITTTKKGKYMAAGQYSLFANVAFAGVTQDVEIPFTVAPVLDVNSITAANQTLQRTTAYGANMYYIAPAQVTLTAKDLAGETVAVPAGWTKAWVGVDNTTDDNQDAKGSNGMLFISNNGANAGSVRTPVSATAQTGATKGIIRVSDNGAAIGDIEVSVTITE